MGSYITGKFNFKLIWFQPIIENLYRLIEKKSCFLNLLNADLNFGLNTTFFSISHGTFIVKCIVKVKTFLESYIVRDSKYRHDFSLAITEQKLVAPI